MIVGHSLYNKDRIKKVQLKKTVFFKDLELEAPKNKKKVGEKNSTK